MPRILSRQTYKGTFIHDQQMFWLDLPEDRRAEGMEPEIFRLAGVSDEGSPQILAGMRLKQNPWQSVERYDVLHKGQRLDGTSWQYLCVTVGAGTGKTMAMEQTEYLLAQHDPQSLNIFLEFTQIRHGVNSIMGTSKASAMSDQDTPLLIRELQKITVNGQHMSGAEAWDMLQRKIQQGKLTLVIDALDQFSGKLEVARESAVALQEFLQRYPQVRCVISGRQFAVKRFWEELFAHLNWDFVQLGTFSEEQCIRRVGQERWDFAKRLGNVSISVPRWLDVLRDIKDLSLLKEEIRSLSELYLRSLESLITSALNQQPDALKEDRAWYLFSLLAFEMMTDPIGPYRGQSAGIDSRRIGEFKLRIWDERAVKTKNDTYRLPGLNTDLKDFDAFDSMLGQLGALNEMLDDPVIAGTPEDPAVMTQIFWRDQTLQDMFTALWMTRWVTDEDCDRLRSRLFVRWNSATHDYEDMWRLATEMPIARNGRVNEAYIRAMSVLYTPSTPGRAAIRSTEMIWRCWGFLQELCYREGALSKVVRAVVALYQSEYRSILLGSRGAEAQRICEHFEQSLCTVEVCLQDRNTHSERTIQDVASFEISRELVGNGLFELFENDLGNRYASHGFPLDVEQYSSKVDGFIFNPVVAIDWFDAFAISVWLGCQLPTRKENVVAVQLNQVFQARHSMQNPQKDSEQQPTSRESNVETEFGPCRMFPYIDEWTMEGAICSVQQRHGEGFWLYALEEPDQKRVWQYYWDPGSDYGYHGVRVIRKN